MSVGPITIHASNRYFLEPPGTPFLWLFDTGWFICANATRELATEYLELRASQGFTGIQTMMAHLEWQTGNYPNQYGAQPFLNNDIGQPNPAYFDHVEWILDECLRPFGGPKSVCARN
jgi:hypothetical protein